ncbi:10608_t:CDS:1 [Paraglomus occultum]|uniref:10608_t:CDS:1 n=1 Tax=Paraglomus occultum TaxID=144539 RepID=A0A9N9GQW6_9GLOM|nr:10608_t:CDS:1 [Paraglomus occultum]
MSDNRKLGLNVAQDIARSKGGECLSDIYINSHNNLLWKCGQGHTWYASLHNVKKARGTWCAKCNGCTKLDISIAIDLAQQRKGKCLSKKYINNHMPLLWECSKGHQWSTSLSSVKRLGSWCPYCSGRHSCSLDLAKKIANERNGKCLSEQYININKYLLWECNQKHTWYASLHDVKNGNHWCAKCAKNKPYNLEFVKNIANSRSGECLSENYVNAHTKLMWKCVNGHKWTASLASIMHCNSWCPYCKHKHENLCREIVAKYLGPPSENRWPDFLKTPEHPTGLQLDIPYYHYGFAIEVQGIQHEQYIQFFHRGDQKNFIKQQEHDQLKRELCEENWIVLRYVWYYEDPFEKIPDILRELGLIS